MIGQKLTSAARRVIGQRSDWAYDWPEVIIVAIGEVYDWSENVRTASGERRIIGWRSMYEQTARRMIGQRISRTASGEAFGWAK